MELREHQDTIAAKATPPGVGGVGIIRISGSQVKKITEQIIGKIIKPRQAEYLPFFSEEKEIIDQGIALFFKAPHSFTGEDVLELQGHGGPVVMDHLLQSVINLGARLARPGEFLQRAFINNKIDLLQAEAVQDLIEANSKAEVRAAMRSLQGEFSRQIDALVADVIHLRMFVEACIDFPEEELDLLKESELSARLQALITQILKIEKQANLGAMLSKGIKVVIAGKPNAGKSSLLNALSGMDSAIVSNIPGTTRDVLKETINIDGLKIDLVDTAGLRETTDSIEQEGVLRAQKELALADHIILVVDALMMIDALTSAPISSTDESTQTSGPISSFDESKSSLDASKRAIDASTHSLEAYKLAIDACIHPLELLPELQPLMNKGAKITVFVNKIDLLPPGKTSALAENNQTSIPDSTDYSIIQGSLKTGEGLENFREHLKKALSFSPTETSFIARRRHLTAIRLALTHLQTAEQHFNQSIGYEFIAEELRLSQLALDSITGKFSSDDLLGKIFSEFCIGK